MRFSLSGTIHMRGVFYDFPCYGGSLKFTSPAFCFFGQAFTAFLKGVLEQRGQHNGIIMALGVSAFGFLPSSFFFFFFRR